MCLYVVAKQRTMLFMMDKGVVCVECDQRQLWIQNQNYRTSSIKIVQIL